MLKHLKAVWEFLKAVWELLKYLMELEAATADEAWDYGVRK